jgi:hypothetical protein
LGSPKKGVVLGLWDILKSNLKKEPSNEIKEVSWLRVSFRPIEPKFFHTPPLTLFSGDIRLFSGEIRLFPGDMR